MPIARGERLEGEVAQVVPVEQDDALGGVVQAGDQIGEGGFSSAGGADQRDQLPGRGTEGDSLQGDLPRLGGRLRCLAEIRFVRSDRPSADQFFPLPGLLQPCLTADR